MSKVIISCAVTGAVHTPTMSPHLPITPQEIARQAIAEATDAVVNITTGGGQGMSLDERLAAPLRASPELCSLNMGSMNFGMYPMLARYMVVSMQWDPESQARARDGGGRSVVIEVTGAGVDRGQGRGPRWVH